jgi:hypothetical protein
VFKKLEDGREICLQNAAGHAERKHRKMRCWQRQGGICGLCPHPVSLFECAFEIMGDDRIIDSDGNLVNSVCHRRCRDAKYPKKFQPIVSSDPDLDSEFFG